jgi:hypothetical protein
MESLKELLILKDSLRSLFQSLYSYQLPSYVFRGNNSLTPAECPSLLAV